MKPVIAIAIIAIILGLILGRAFKRSILQAVKQHFMDEDQP